MKKDKNYAKHQPKHETAPLPIYNHPNLMPHGFFTVVRDYYTKYRESVLNPALSEPVCPAWCEMNLPVEVVDVLDDLYCAVGGDVERMMRYVAVRFGEMPAAPKEQPKQSTDELYNRVKYGTHYNEIWKWSVDWLTA